MTRYGIVLYRDEPDEAAAHQESMDIFPGSSRLAIGVAREALKDGWTSATVHEGHMETRRADGGQWEVWVDDERVRWYVGADYADKEVTA